MDKSEQFLFERLQQSPVEYIAHSVLGDTQAVIEFAGQLEGQALVWHARIIALKAAGQACGAQYIDVSENSMLELPLNVEIGLQVARIEESTVLMVIKMMRQWKNLHRGRHEFLGANK